MDDVVRIEFKERSGQWFPTLYSEDGVSRPGEPFPASGHPHYPKDQQVRDRVGGKLNCEITSMSSDATNGNHYVVGVKPR